MTDSQCMGRLLASATHDMRNVLAVIRESAGLAQDMVQLAAGADKPADPRVIKALKEAQQQILRGAALAECMEYLAQVSHSENENAPCDLARVASTFCPAGPAPCRWCWNLPTAKNPYGPPCPPWRCCVPCWTSSTCAPPWAGR